MNLIYTEENRKALDTFVGKVVEHYCTGLKVMGTITEIKENQYGIEITTSHKKVFWGGENYTESYLFIRKCDGKGSENIKLDKIKLSKNEIIINIIINN